MLQHFLKFLPLPHGHGLLRFRTLCPAASACSMSGRPVLPDAPKIAILLPHNLPLDPQTLAPALRSC
jgi:hypothetical protein